MCVRRAVACVLLAAGCSDPPHTNPFDPSTPESQQARATLSGTVQLESAGGAAPSLSGVLVSVSGPKATRTAFTDGTGAWTASDVPAGTYAISATLSGYRDGWVSGVTVTLDDGGATVTAPPIVLALGRGAVAGVARLASAAFHSGVQVTLTPAPTAGDPTPLPVAAVLTDAAGSWLAEQLPVGSYRVDYAKVPGYVPQSASVTVVKGTVTAATVSLALDTGGSISGAASVARPAGANGGIAVSLTGADLNGAPVARATTTADPTNEYQLTGLPQGTYTITFSRSQYEPQVVSGIFVAAGRAVIAPAVTLPVASGGVAGTVALDVSTVPGLGAIADRSGTLVILADGATQVGATLTDASGAFRFATVPALPVAGPTYELSARRTHFATATLAVAPQAGTTLPGNDLTLDLQPGTIGGAVVLWDDVGGAGANPSSAGATVALTGTAFTGARWTPAPAITGPDGAWSVAALPPGSFEIVVTSPGRACAAHAAQAVQAGTTTDAGSVRCTDTVAPGVVGLGAPLATGAGTSGWISTDGVTIPVVTQATDATSPASNLWGYQTVVGAAPSWGAAALVATSPSPPTSLTVNGLAAGSSTIWVRAIDWAGNAGEAVSVQVVRDVAAPSPPIISTPQAFVSNTTSSVTLTGSDADPSFLRYEACWASGPVTSGCAGSPPCAPSPVAQTFPLPLSSGERTCVWAQAVDRAGNTSPRSVASVVSDQQAPTPPGVTPAYDPATLTVRSGWVDLFVQTPATDQPGSGAPWAGVAWIEIDSGLGFAPLCPAAACHAGGVYAPCACGCSDPRLRCGAPSGGSVEALRVALASGGSTRVAVRAVDLAGNVGDAVGQEIRTDAGADVVAATASGAEYRPRISGTVLTFEHYDSATPGKKLRLLDLGADGRPGPSDQTCDLPGAVGAADPGSGSLVAFVVGTGVRGLRKGAGWCSAPSFSIAAIANEVADVAAAGERVAYVRSSGSMTLHVVEPGGDRLVGTGDDASTQLLDTFVVRDPQAGERAVLVETLASPSDPAVWKLFSAAVSFADGFQSVDLPMAPGDLPALSRGGTLVAFTDGSSSPRKLCARYAGADRTFDANDAVACVVPSPALPATKSLAADANHIVVSTADKRMVHWAAGPDGQFGTPDDTLTTIRQSPNEQLSLSISSGLLVWREDTAILMRDLSAVRWETLNPALVPGPFISVKTNGTGTVLWAAGTTSHSRSPDGYETARFGLSSNWDVSGTDLLAKVPGGLAVLAPDPSTGLFFGPGATETPVYGSYDDLGWVEVKPGRALFWEWNDAATKRLWLLEARGASLATIEPADVVQLDTIPGSEFVGGTLAPRQALYSCAPDRRTCVAGEGDDGFFGTGDEPAVTALVHPPGSGRDGFEVQNAYVKADGAWLVASEHPTVWTNGGLYAIDSGRDGLFATPDDAGFTVSSTPLFPSQFSIAGEWLAYLDGGAPGGKQVYLLNLTDRSVRQLTSHFSTKDNLVVDRSGHVFWVDGVFTTGAIFTRAP